MKICIIPARGGSRRIPRKNIKEFCGKPIIAYAIGTAKQVCDRVIVSTEDPEIAEISSFYGAEVFQRSFEMARDEIGTQRVMQDAVDELRIRSGRCVCLYATTPLVRVGDLARGSEYKSGYAVAVGANPLRDAGTFYWGTAADFRNGVPLYSDDTRLIVLPEEQICDINTEEDWARAEELYKQL